ncbi:MAG: hypothetical protein OXF67_09330 [Cyanobacteria bacterium MAG CAR4_bin_6]|nr:hypothetical protein [Cyanobacteria bacterium MAG CAR4_bin_6]
MNTTSAAVDDVAAAEGNISRLRVGLEATRPVPLPNDRLTLTPAVALALSPSTSTYGILWSLAPYSEQGQIEPWEIALEGERQQHSSPAASVDHSLTLRFSLPF